MAPRAEKDISADVSVYGGQAPYFLIFDNRANLLDSFANPFLEMDRHAGYEVAKMMAKEGVDVLIAGLLGPTMINELSSQGIRCVSKSGSAQSAVLQLDL